MFVTSATQLRRGVFQRVRPVLSHTRQFSQTSARFQQHQQQKQGSKSTPLLTVSLCLGSAIAGYTTSSLSSSPTTPSTAATTKISDLKPLTFANEQTIHSAIAKIKTIVGSENITTSQSELDNHSTDSSNFVPPKPTERPYAIVYPTTADQVSQILKICHEETIPVIPYSGGTSIEGHFIPTRGGICLDVSKMNAIIALHEDDLDVVVQPGVGWMELNEYLEPLGLMFGPDPGPGAMIGGILATNASGPNAVRFGAAKDNVLSLTVVLADGTIIKTKNRPRKSSNGYNLTNLFVGSEGTLGIVVEATLKVHVKPQNEVITLLNFESIGDATKTVSGLFKAGITCNALEFMDDRQMTAISEMGTGGNRVWSPHHLLLVKLSAPNSQSLKDVVETVKVVGLSNNAFNIEVAVDEETKDDIWRVRKTLLWNSLQWAKQKKPNATILPTDVCVPISNLPKLITLMMDKFNDADLLATAAGHAGDGNLHVLVIYEPDQVAVAHKLINEMSKLAIELDGTVSGEHGIGVSDKRELLEMELGTDTVDLMRTVKFALDKKGILNPDHIFKIDPTENRQPFA